MREKERVRKIKTERRGGGIRFMQMSVRIRELKGGEIVQKKIKDKREKYNEGMINKYNTEIYTFLYIHYVISYIGKKHVKYQETSDEIVTIFVNQNLNCFLGGTFQTLFSIGWFTSLHYQ